MSTYMNAIELAEMIECEPNSYACMRRWLKKNSWPFEPNRRGFPQVSRTYYEARMSGKIVPDSGNDDFAEPDFSMFQAA